MNLSETMRTLEEAGSAQTRKTYGRHGIRREMFGVSYATLGALKKKIKTDHDLAAQLWQTGNHDAMAFATMIADPARMSGKELDAWAKDLDSYAIADAFCRFAAQTPHARAKAEKWRAAKSEWISTAGWGMTGVMAQREDIPDEAFEGLFDVIEKEIRSAPNRTRHAMNGALIAMGIRAGLTKKALAAAKRIGRVEVDHGDTDCKTPDAAAYIEKTLARKAGARGRAKGGAC